eukprot:GHVH01004066.1.p1 GENE.GHVH01004066.1~~GHVH01004066.1.p1  ORF type:complete len:926 (-),score=162.65 GHVH01004066.1:1595-4372(-)
MGDATDEFMALQAEMMYEQGAEHGAILNSRNLSEDSDYEERRYVTDNFSMTERELMVAGYYYAHNFITVLPKVQWQKLLDQWPVRQNGSQLIPGQHKTFFRRLINGADIKNQTQSAIAASAICHYLNFFQLLQMWHVQQINGDWTRSPNKVVSEFACKIEECLNEKLIKWLMTRTSSNTPIDEDYFTISEKRFLGRSLFRILGALDLLNQRGIQTHFVKSMSVWMLFLHQEDDSQTVTRGDIEGHDVSEPVGLFVEFPTLHASIKRPQKSVMSLSTFHGAKSTYTKHYFCFLKSDPEGSLKPYVDASLRYQDPKFVQHDRRTRRTSAVVSPETDAASVDENDPQPTHREQVTKQKMIAMKLAEQSTCDEEEQLMYAAALEATGPVELETPTTADTVMDAAAGSPEEDEGFWGDDGYFYYKDKETGDYYAYADGEEEGGDPVEEGAEEGYVLYWDPYWEMYVWYGMQVEYDAEEDWFYACDNESGEFHWLDEESNTALVNGDVPTWDYDPGQYYDEGDGGDQLNEVPEGYYLADDGYCYPLEDTFGDLDGENDTTPTIEVEETVSPDRKTADTDSCGIESDMKKDEIEESVASSEVPVELEPVVVPEDKEVIPDVESTSVKSVKAIPKPSLKAVVGDPSLVRVLGQAMDNQYRFGSHAIETIKASEQMLFGRAVSSISEELNKSLSDDQYETVMDSWRERSNGQLYVGKCKRLILGLMAGNLELKSLPQINLTDMSTVLPHMNLIQIIAIRLLAQNSAWDRSPNSGMKVFALKADSMISEKTLQYCIIRSMVPNGGEEKDFVNFIVNGIPKDNEEKSMKIYNTLTSRERQYIGHQIVHLFGATTLWKDKNNRFNTNSWWFFPASISSKFPLEDPTSSPQGLFFNVPSMTTQWNIPDLKEGENIYHMGAGASNPGYVLWNITAVPLK